MKLHIALSIFLFTSSCVANGVGFEDLTLPALNKIPEVEKMQEQIKKSIDGAKERADAKQKIQPLAPKAMPKQDAKPKAVAEVEAKPIEDNQRAPVLFYMKIENGEANLVSTQEGSFTKSTTNDLKDIKQVESEKKNETQPDEPNLKKSIKPIISRTKYKELGLDERYFNAYDYMFKTAEIISKDNEYVLNAINGNFQKHLDNIAGDENLNIFFFVDSAMSDEMFLRFSKEVGKILSSNKNITARIITNGLVITKEERDSIQTQIYKAEKILSELKSKEKDTKNIEKEIQNLKYKKEGDFDTFYRWAQKLYATGLRNVKIQFHPQAFKDLDLNKVPAYLLSRCHQDFRFQTCKHIAVVRGNVSLLSFFEMLKEDKPEFGEFYEALLKQDI